MCLQQETTPQSGPEVIRPSRYPPLPLEGAKIILAELLLQGEYDEVVCDNLIRLLAGIQAFDHLYEVHDYIDWLLRFLYAESHDCASRRDAYLWTLPHKSYRDDGITLEDLAALRDPDKATELALKLKSLKQSPDE